MYIRRELGIWGENIAIRYLQKNDYIIIERNFSCRQGEIDIIAKDTNKNELVFFEVKTRTNNKYGTPVDAVNKLKRNHICKCAEYYIYKYKLYKVFIRFDIIEITVKKGTFSINQIKNAF